MSENAIVGVVMSILFGSWAIIALISIALFILMSMGLMTIANKRKIENPWLAWIPIANMYILGKIIKEVSIFDFNIKNMEIVLPIGAACVMLGVIPILGWFIALAVLILNYTALYKLYKMYRPEKATIYIVLSIIFHLSSLFVFLIRNDEETFNM